MPAGIPKPSLNENVSTTLAAGITDVATSMDVADASAIVEPCYLVIDRVDSAGALKNTAFWEYVKVTNVSSNTLTVTRGQGGSVGQSHSSGAIVEAVVTSAMFEDWYAALNPEHTATGGHVISIATVAELNAPLSVIGAATISTMTVRTHLSVSGASISGMGFVTTDGVQTLTNKTLTSPKINEDVALTPTSTELNYIDGSTDWVDYSAISTIVGWTSFTTKVIMYKKIGKLVFVQYNLIGTSDSTTTSFTVPTNNDSYVLYCAGGIAGDNGGARVAGMIYMASGSNVVGLYDTTDGTSWTNSGTKTAQGQFCYVEA